MRITFEDYQTPYETVLPLKLREALTSTQVKFHRGVNAINAAFEIPKFALKTIQFALEILSLLPSLKSSLERSKQICKDAKNFTNCIKGLKSIDGFLNFKPCWKSIILNISGLTLFIVSSLSLAEIFTSFNIAAIKTSLAAIPIFGILPWGGLLPFSMVGLTSMLALFALKKRNKLEKQEAYVKNEKLIFWSQSLDLSKVQQRQTKYQTNVLSLKKEIAACKKLIRSGRQIRKSLKFNQTYPIFTCQKALNELTKNLKEKQTELAYYQKKAYQWTLLKKEWRTVDQKKLEEFREAKAIKWEKKLNKIKNEKIANSISIINNVITLFRKSLVIVGAALGYGLIGLPAVVNIGLDAFVAGSTGTNFFMKRSIKKMAISSVNLEDFLKLRNA